MQALTYRKKFLDLILLSLLLKTPDGEMLGSGLVKRFTTIQVLRTFDDFENGRDMTGLCEAVNASQHGSPLIEHRQLA